MVFFFQLILKFQKRSFGKWGKLEEVRMEIVDRAVENDASAVAKLIIAYISTALPFFPAWIYSKIYWAKTFSLFSLLTNFFAPKRKIPLLASHNGKTSKDNIVSWDYPGRYFYYLIHVLAKAYGWSVKYIYDLDIDDALALLQEILTNEQLEKEFLHGLSEVSYSYDQSTKSSKLVPLPRPYWMLAKAKPIKLIKMRKDLIPQGVSNAEQMEELIRRFKEHYSKTAQSGRDGRNL